MVWDAIDTINTSVEYLDWEHMVVNLKNSYLGDGQWLLIATVWNCVYIYYILCIYIYIIYIYVCIYIYYIHNPPKLVTGWGTPTLDSRDRAVFVLWLL